MQIDYSSVVMFPDSMAIGRIVHYNFSVSIPGNHGYGLTIVFLLYEQIDVVMYSCFSAYKCIDTPTAVQKHLYRCFRQHFKNLTCIKISDHKISIYQCNPYTSDPPFFFFSCSPAPTRQASLCPAGLKTRPSYAFRRPGSTPGVRKSLPGLPRSLTRCPELDRSPVIRPGRIPPRLENAACTSYPLSFLLFFICFHLCYYLLRKIVHVDSKKKANFFQHI